MIRFLFEETDPMRREETSPIFLFPLRLRRHPSGTG